MEKEKQLNTSSDSCNIIHVTVLGGDTEQVSQVRDAFIKFQEVYPDLNLRAIFTNEDIRIGSISRLVEHLEHLKEGEKDAVSNMPKRKD